MQIRGRQFKATADSWFNAIDEGKIREAHALFKLIGKPGNVNHKGKTLSQALADKAGDPQFRGDRDLANFRRDVMSANAGLNQARHARERGLVPNTQVPEFEFGSNGIDRYLDRADNPPFYGPLARQVKELLEVQRAFRSVQAANARTSADSVTSGRNIRRPMAPPSISSMATQQSTPSATAQSTSSNSTQDSQELENIYSRILGSPRSSGSGHLGRTTRDIRPPATTPPSTLSAGTPRLTRSSATQSTPSNSTQNSSHASRDNYGQISDGTRSSRSSHASQTARAQLTSDTRKYVRWAEKAMFTALSNNEFETAHQFYISLSRPFDLTKHSQELLERLTAMQSWYVSGQNRPLDSFVDSVRLKLGMERQNRPQPSYPVVGSALLDFGGDLPPHIYDALNHLTQLQMDLQTAGFRPNSQR